MAQANGSFLAKCNDILVCRDLVVLQHNFIFQGLRDNFEDTMVKLGWILEQVPAIIAQSCLPVVKVLMEVFEIIAFRSLVENLPLGVLHELRAALVLQV